MLSINPSSHDIATALPTTTARFRAILALPEWRADENPAPVLNAKLVKSAGRGRIKVTAADIPFDYPCGPISIPHTYQAAVKKFEHTPTITYRRGQRVTVVTGPVEPTVPRTTKATQDGWKKWFGDVDDARSAAIQDAKVRAAKRKAYFGKRAADKEAEYQARCDRAVADGRPIPKRKKRRQEVRADWLSFVKDPELVDMIREARFVAEKKKRLRKFEHNGHAPLGGRVYVPFSEKFENEDGTTTPAVRSWLGTISGQLFNSALPKGHIEYGFDKEVEYSTLVTGLPRLYALDAPYIVLDKCRKCAFIVDLDGWWNDLRSLRWQLRRLLPPEFMPNIITFRGAVDGKGGVENPHLVWLLPPGSRVIGHNKIKARKNLEQQRKLHEMIQSGIVSHLIPVGADPGHTNVNKTKNPLSASFSVEFCDDHFRTMDDWRSFLPTITPKRQEMQRRAKIHRASQQSGASDAESMAIWNDAIAARSILIPAAQRRQDPAYLAAVKQRKNMAFVDWLYDDKDGVVVNRLLEVHQDSKALRAVVREQRQYVIDLNLTPSERGEWCNFGRDAEANKEELRERGLKPLAWNATKEERVARGKLLKHWARQRTQQNKEAIHCGLIKEEIERRLASGVPVVKAEVVKVLVKAGTVSRSVAYAHFDFVREVVLRTARYQDHTSSSSSSQASNPVISQPVEIVPVVESGDQIQLVTVQSPGQLIDTVQNPVKTSSQPSPPAWVISKDTLTEWMNACWLCDEWAIAVAAWRSARHRQPDDGVDLAKDPGFREMVLNRSAWAHRRKH